ncbi:hypothetical protein FCH28_22715 [Streptomyces piniterrae]|uniref:Tat pathway signal sequence domain protein n=1 Tax=Streptomyces piniterrae TaxID=2571125 RepID=A0A4U0N929_9ACTN|nr:hypothetical protein [Streptomyces piniterrae]TJZ50133.1 hypothetical protein FCH28_22715 [Streptomyces piniterrae]
MAPRLRTRITTGLLAAAAVLPVPLAATAATASGGWATPIDRPPDLIRQQASRPQAPPGSYAADPALAGSLAGAGRGHPGRPESMTQAQQNAGSGALARPDSAPRPPENPEAFSDRPPRAPNEPPGRPPRAQHPRAPSGPEATAPAPSASAPEPGGAATDFPDSPDLSAPPDADGAETPASPSGPTPPASDEAASSPAQPPSEGDRDLAGRLARRPYEPLPPMQSPSTPERQPGSELGTTDNGPATPASPYAMDAPVSRVERVLPLGAGLAFTGLGLAFFGLRLRRR